MHLNLRELAEMEETEVFPTSLFSQFYKLSRFKKAFHPMISIRIYRLNCILGRKLILLLSWSRHCFMK